MLTVSILVNGHPIYTRSAVNVETTRVKGIGRKERDLCTYKLDDGKEILHYPDEGAIPLAIQMLEKIVEVKK